MVFFDSHGAAWMTCSAEDAGAEAFGPTGVAKSITAYTMLKLLISKAEAALEEDRDPETSAGRSCCLSFFDLNEREDGFTTAG